MKTTDILIVAVVAGGAFILYKRMAHAVAVAPKPVTVNSNQAKALIAEQTLLWVLNNAKPYYDAKTGTVTSSSGGTIYADPTYGAGGNYSTWGDLVESTDPTLSPIWV